MNFKICQLTAIQALIVLTLHYLIKLHKSCSSTTLHFHLNSKVRSFEKNLQKLPFNHSKLLR